MTEEFGVITTGFRRRSKEEILDELRQRALNDSTGFGPHADLGATSPLGRFYAGLAEQLALVEEMAESIYYSGFIPTAEGAALSDKTQEMGISRRAATKAKTIVTFYGDAGTVLAAGQRLQATSGVIFLTTERVVMPTRGQIDVEVEAEEAGASGNVAKGALTTQVNPAPGISSVANEYDPGTKLSVGANTQGSMAVANDGLKNDYQLVHLESIRHPHHLDELSVRVRNDGAETALFLVHLEVLDHANGAVLGRTETQTLSLAEDEAIVLEFTNQGIDVHGASGNYLRIVLVNEEASEDALGWCYDDANPYTRGSLYENTTGHPTWDAILSLTSTLPGSATGGDDGETDLQLRLRYRVTSATFGNATAEAIRSQVYRVEGTKSVSVRQNRSNETVDGMTPHSVEVTVYGGDPQGIAEAIFAAAPAGCELLGTSTVTVKDTVGQPHSVKFNKARRVLIYVGISLTVDGSFSHDAGIEAMQDALIGYIGGENHSGTFLIGLLPGQDVIYRRLVALAMGIPGVVDAQLTVGTSPEPASMTNVAIAVDEVAETKVECIEVVVG